MNCVNRSHPDFIRLVKLTGGSESEVELAVAMWQEHNATNGFPSSSQVISMLRNRQTFGGMDQYLKSISNPVLKADLDVAIKNLPARVDNVLSALKAILPDIQVVLHDSQDTFTDEVKKATGSEKNRAGSGFYYNNEIHLNVPKMLQMMSKNNLAALNTTEHEGVHPILETIEMINPGSVASLFESLVKIEKDLGLDGKYSVKFASRYPDSQKKEEAITEFIADIASGNLDVKKLDTSSAMRIKRFLVDLFKSLGIDLSNLINKKDKLISLAKDIKSAFDSGKGLERVVNGTEYIKYKDIPRMQIENDGTDGEKDLYLQKVLDYARKIIKGNRTLERLGEKEERARISGGQRNVEASAIAGTGKETSRGDQEGYDERQRQEERLIQYAKQEGIWVDDYRSIFGDFLDKGGESIVYYDGDIVTKINDFSFHDEPIQFFDRITIHNLLFPESPYKVIGFTFREDTDSFSVIVQQPFINRKRKATKQEIDNYMRNLGYTSIGGNGYINENYIVEDLHSGNVFFSPQGKLVFIDPIIHINTADEGYGGTRIVNDIVPFSSDINDLRFQLNDDLQNAAINGDYIALTNKSDSMTSEGNKYVFFSYDHGERKKYGTKRNIDLLNAGWPEWVVKIRKSKVYPVEENPKNYKNDNIEGIKESAGSDGMEAIVWNVENGTVANIISKIDPVKTNNHRINFKIPEGAKITYSDDIESLSNADYYISDGKTKKILSANKDGMVINLKWQDESSGELLHTRLSTFSGKSKTIHINNKIKFSLDENDNSDNTKTELQESIAFGRLVSDIAEKIKEGVTDIKELKEAAGVSSDNIEIWSDAYDIAMIRAGHEASNIRQSALSDIISQLPEGENRPTAQEFYRKNKALLDGLMVNLKMIKQILPDESIIHDVDINQTWKRILKVTNDVGSYVSKTLHISKKFNIDDSEGLLTGYWDQAATGFSDMLSYVNAAIEDDPSNKQKLTDNVKEAIKKDSDNDMLRLLEVAIAASGETTISDLAKVVRAGSNAGRVLNVIKRYINNDNFGKIKSDLAAATMIGENDTLLENIKLNENNSENALSLSDEILTILKVEGMTPDERKEFFKQNNELIEGIKDWLAKLKLIPIRRDYNPTNAEVRVARRKITTGVSLLKDILSKQNPSRIKQQTEDFGLEAIKSIRQIVRGVINIYGTDQKTIILELQKVFDDNGILLDSEEIVTIPEIKKFIYNAERYRIRAAVIESMAAKDDILTKSIIDMVLKKINVPASTGTKKERLIDAMDRGEITSEVVDQVRKEINKIEDADNREKMLARLENKFTQIAEGAVKDSVLKDSVEDNLGKITKEIVESYIVDPTRTIDSLMLSVMDKIEMTKEQAEVWANEIEKKVKEKLEKSKTNKLKSLLRDKISSKSTRESLEQKILKVILIASDDNGYIGKVKMDNAMLDIKDIISKKYGISLTNPHDISKIIQLTELLRKARTQARRNQIQAEILLAIRTISLSQNKIARAAKSVSLELANFIMANILSGINSMWKAAIGGFFNSGVAYIQDTIIGKSIDWYYGTDKSTKAVNEALNELNNKNPANHLFASIALFYDIMRNGSAAISQANIPEHGLSHFDNALNHLLSLRLLYSPFRFLSAIDSFTRSINEQRLARRRAINGIIEFGRNNVVVNGVRYSRTAGGSSWYIVTDYNQPKIDRNGNIDVIRDQNLVKILNERAKENMSTSEFVAEVELILGEKQRDKYYDEVIKEWNALVDLYNIPDYSVEEKKEMSRLGLQGSDMVKINSIEDLKNMSYRAKRFVSLHIARNIEHNQNVAVRKYVHRETGSYSAQGMEIPGVPAGLFYMAATAVDKAIQSGVKSENPWVQLFTVSVALPAKMYSFLITKAPAIGYGAALLYSPVNFLVNTVNLAAYMAGRPFLRISYDAKQQKWLYNGLSVRDIQIATGVKNLTSKDILLSTNKDVLRTLKEGYTVSINENNTFELKENKIVTIGGQDIKTTIATIMAKQAIATAAFMALINAMIDCPDDEPCSFNEFGTTLISAIGLKGYGSNKDWLSEGGKMQKYLGHRQVVNKYGLNHENTMIVFPKIGYFEAKIPTNEMNHAVAAITLARIKDEMDAGVKLSKNDILLRYLIYSNWDLLVQNADMSADGIEELYDVVTSIWETGYTAREEQAKAAKSLGKRITNMLVPKLINEVDRFLLDKEDRNMYSPNFDDMSVKEASFIELVAMNSKLNIPFIRRYVDEDSKYSKLPFTYEWTDWQLYLAHMPEEGESPTDIQVGNYKINFAGRITTEYPDGEVKGIKKKAIASGKGDYKNGGYLNTSDEFDRLYGSKIKESNISELLDNGQKSEALDLMNEIANEVKESTEFKRFKKTQLK